MTSGNSLVDHSVADGDASVVAAGGEEREARVEPYSPHSLLVLPAVPHSATQQLPGAPELT